MTDLVKRLREISVQAMAPFDWRLVANYAADRIEQLEADKERQIKEIQDCRDQLRRGQDILIERAKRIEQLEAQVKQLDRANNTLARFNAKQGKLIEDFGLIKSHADEKE